MHHEGGIQASKGKLQLANLYALLFFNIQTCGIQHLTLLTCSNVDAASESSSAAAAAASLFRLLERIKAAVGAGSGTSILTSISGTSILIMASDAEEEASEGALEARVDTTGKPARNATLDIGRQSWPTKNNPV